MSVVGYRSDIDGLRSLAVLPVVIFHAAPGLLPGGFLGVDIFFVISGYLISLILFRQQSGGSFSFLDFYGRRIRRLFPALILVLLASLGFGFFALFANEYELLGRHAGSAIVFLLNLRLLGEVGYFDVAAHTKPLLHLWSLSVEEQFYVFWPILLLLCRRLRAGWVELLVGSALLSCAYALWLGDINPDKPYYHPLARFWELLAGAAVAYMHHKQGVNWLPAWLQGSVARNALSLAGLLLLSSALLAFGGALQHPGLATLWPLAGAVTLIATGPDAMANRLLAWRPLVWIGLISYPLYLWHWPILSYLRIVQSGDPAQWMLWAGAVLALVLAWLTYRWVELPLRTAKDRRRVTASLAAAMGGLLVASIAIASQKGLPVRSALQYLQKHESQMVREARQDKSCVDLFKSESAPVYCRQHKPGERMIAIVGDSHAHALFPGVAELAATHGYGTLLLANSGCPPLMGTVMGRNSAEQQQCAQSIQKILDALGRDGRVRTAIIVTRGPQYLTGLGFGSVEKHYSYPPITVLALGASAVTQNPTQIFMDGLSHTATLLHKQGLRVAYLLQVPELGVPARDCLGRPLTLPGRLENCTVKYETYADRMRSYRVHVLNLRDLVPFIDIIDAEELFCSPAGCSGFIDDQLLYADDNHLSVLGSRRLAPLVLNAALAGEGGASGSTRN